MMKLIEQVILLPYPPGFLIISQIRQEIAEQKINRLLVMQEETKSTKSSLAELKQRLNEQFN